mgnify:CR=1 FL=1
MTRRANPGTSDVMPESRSATRAIPIAVIAVLLLALQFYSPPRIGLWANVFYDSLHVPVFGLIAISLYNIFSRRLNWPKSLIAAFVVACLLGGLSEIAQIATSRDASWRDIVSNCLGAAGFLAIYVTLWPPHPTSGTKRCFNAGIGALILGVALAPLIHVSAAYAERNLQRPVIAHYGSKQLSGLAPQIDQTRLSEYQSRYPRLEQCHHHWLLPVGFHLGAFVS